MGLDDRGSFRPFGSDAGGMGELNVNVNERKCRSQRRGQADHNDPSVARNNSACNSPRSVTEEITGTMGLLVTSAASGSPKTEAKLSGWLMTVGM